MERLEYSVYLERNTSEHLSIRYGTWSAHQNIWCTLSAMVVRGGALIIGSLVALVVAWSDAWSGMYRRAFILSGWRTWSSAHRSTLGALRVYNNECIVVGSICFFFGRLLPLIVMIFFFFLRCVVFVPPLHLFVVVILHVFFDGGGSGEGGGGFSLSSWVRFCVSLVFCLLE